MIEDKLLVWRLNRGNRDALSRIYEKYRDDPKAGWAWFKHYLDSLNSMGKVVGGYAPENQVNIGVQVGQCATCSLRKPLAEQMRESEAYFQSIEDARTCPHCGKLVNEKEMKLT